MNTPDRSGWVYLLRCGWHHKIGKSKDVRQRVSDMQTANPYLIELVCAIWADNMAVVEGMLHREYRSYRENGEWFEFSGISQDAIVDRFNDIGMSQSRYVCMYSDWDIVDYGQMSSLLEPQPLHSIGNSLRMEYVGKRYPSSKRPRYVMTWGGILAVEYDEDDEKFNAALLNSRPGDFTTEVPRPGDRVKHDTLGEGVVLESKLVTLKDFDNVAATETTVSFRGKSRRLIVGMAGLVRL